MNLKTPCLNGWFNLIHSLSCTVIPTTNDTQDLELNHTLLRFQLSQFLEMLLINHSNIPPLIQVFTTKSLRLENVHLMNLFLFHYFWDQISATLQYFLYNWLIFFSLQVTIQKYLESQSSRVPRLQMMCITASVDISVEKSKNIWEFFIKYQHKLSDANSLFWST